MSKAGRTNACWLGTCCVALLCWTGSGVVPVFAAQYDVGLGFALMHDSNITRTSSPTSDWTEQLFGGFGYEDHGPELNARVLAQVDRRHFARGSFPDDNGYYLDGLAVWTISPRFFTWTLQDVMRELNTSVRDPATPATLQRTNSLSTGPEFAFRVDPANTPVIGARYGRFRVQGIEGNVLTPGDSERYTIYAQWLRQISAPSTLSLNVAATRVYFDPPALFDKMSREDLFFRYHFLQPRILQTLDVGTRRIVQYGGQDYNRPLFRYTGQWSRPSESAIRIFLADQISDAYSDIIQKQDLEIQTLPSIRGEAAAAPLTVTYFATPDIYHSRLGEFTYASQGEILGYSLQGHLRHVDYANLPQDYGEKGGRLSLSWLLSIEARVYAFTQYVKRVFSGIDEQDAERETAAGLNYRLGRTLSLTIEAGQLERRSSVPQFTFVDRRAMLVLGYSTGPLFAPRIRR